jgi:hypothetical protein
LVGTDFGIDISSLGREVAGRANRAAADAGAGRADRSVLAGVSVANEYGTRWLRCGVIWFRARIGARMSALVALRVRVLVRWAVCWGAFLRCIGSA